MLESKPKEVDLKCVLLLTVIVVVFGAGSCPAQDTLWTRLLDLGGNSQVYSVQCQGNDIYLGGSALTTLCDNRNIYAVKYSGSGDLLWTGAAGVDTFEVGSKVAVGPDQSPYLSLLTSSFFGALVKFDTAGETLWTRKRFSTIHSAIVADSSGGCYVFGTVGMPPFPVDSLWLCRYDNAGSTMVDKTLKLGSTPQAAVGLCQLTDGGLAAAVCLMDTVTVAALVKFTSSGDTLWTRKYTDTLAISFIAIAAGESNTCRAIANDLEGTRLVKFGSDGDTVWTVRLRQDGIASDLAVDGSGNCFIAYSGEEKDYYVDKYGPDGQFLGAGHAGTEDQNFPYSLAVGSDGKAVVGGVSMDTSTSDTRGYVVKFSGAPGWVLEPEELLPAGPWRLLGTVTDGTRLDWQIGRPAECHFSVFDPAGRLVCECRKSVLPGRNSLALPGLASGVYLVRLEAKGSAYTSKFVVQR